MSITKTFAICLPAVAAGLAGARSAQADQVAAFTQDATGYTSAFEDYRPFGATEIQDWRVTNDTVREIGGWRAYAREIQGGAKPHQPGPGNSQGQTPADPAQAGSHAGHRK